MILHLESSKHNAILVRLNDAKTLAITVTDNVLINNDSRWSEN